MALVGSERLGHTYPKAPLKEEGICQEVKESTHTLLT